MVDGQLSLGDLTKVNTNIVQLVVEGFESRDLGREMLGKGPHCRVLDVPKEMLHSNLFGFLGTGEKVGFRT